MSKHHRNRNWAPAPQPLPEDAHVIDDHTHVASVVPFSQAMSHEAVEKGQGEVPVYSVDELLKQAQNVGVEGVIDCGCELPNLMTAIDMARERPGVVYAAIAIHPNEAVLHGHRGVPGPDGLPIKYRPWHDISFDDAMAEVHRLATTYPDQVVAIGETGMDLFRTGEGAKELQREAFRAHIALAKELNLPMQIHDRDSHKEVIETLLADGAPERTVFHSYSGDAEMGEIARQNGWYLSLSGTSSYKGNDGIRESAKLVGMSHVMVETDAPYLSPMPYRGRTNAPYMIPYTLQALADYLDKPLANIARATRETTREVYGI
ncbi:TatD family hydrolase [Bifidobacterium ruminantium]|uniref:DNase, TatD family n=1 Tax=Bifidobacterium ruminantium TaxID=78346 RepID=A0A087CY79_BIFRU|nr:TatD family hydrolase [Bifidobacterium ruminantium]KFI88229.1 DNase, TatD family [Bifidobacterium ruminantium]MEE0972278.1 TatD family hydrolase [Bifidobacterium ruminantium]